MDEKDIIIGSTFFAHYPDNDPGARLIKIDLGYNLPFARRLENKEKNAWAKLLKKIEVSKREYEATTG